MSKLTKEQKDKLFSLIHELLEENSELETLLEESGPFHHDESGLFKSFEAKEQELINYVNSL